MNLISYRKAAAILAGQLTIRRRLAAFLLDSSGLKPTHFKGRTFFKREDVTGLADRILCGVATALSETGGAR